MMGINIPALGYVGSRVYLFGTDDELPDRDVGAHRFSTDVYFMISPGGEFSVLMRYKPNLREEFTEVKFEHKKEFRFIIDKWINKTSELNDSPSNDWVDYYQILKNGTGMNWNTGHPIFEDDDSEEKWWTHYQAYGDSDTAFGRNLLIEYFSEVVMGTFIPSNIMMTKEAADHLGVSFKMSDTVFFMNLDKYHKTSSDSNVAARLYFQQKHLKLLHEFLSMDAV